MPVGWRIHWRTETEIPANEPLRDSLENRYPSLGGSRVRIPPPPSALSTFDQISCVSLGNARPCSGDLVDNTCGGHSDCSASQARARTQIGDSPSGFSVDRGEPSRGRHAQARPGRAGCRPPVNPTSSHRADRRKQAKWPKTADQPGLEHFTRLLIGKHNYAICRSFGSRRPDSNRGPLHYELWAAVTTCHQESPQVTRRPESGGTGGDSR
jgi:hypothetical protein